MRVAKEKYHVPLKGFLINPAQPSDDSLNIYFFGNDPDGLLDEFKHNCMSIGYKNIIICDNNYLYELINNWEPPNDVLPREKRLATRAKQADAKSGASAREVEPGTRSLGSLSQLLVVGTRNRSRRAATGGGIFALDVGAAPILASDDHAEAEADNSRWRRRMRNRICD